MKLTLHNHNHSFFFYISLPLPSVLVDNEVRSLSGTISEVNVEGGRIIDLTLAAANPCEV